MNSIFEDKDYWISYYNKLLKSNKNPIPSEIDNIKRKNSVIIIAI